MSSKNQKLNLDRDELYDLYINQMLTSEEIAKIYNCTSRTVRNYLIKYEIPIRSQSDSISLERSKWSPEKELERSRKFSQTFAKRTPEQNKERYDKMNANGTINSPESIKKANETRSKNGTHRTSVSETEFYKKLVLLGFNEDDIIHPYVNDPRYPFNCDFYIKSKDLFIEYQGHQTHGPDIFDKNNEQHIQYLVKMQDRGYDMSTWFKRDPHKLKTALENKINLVLVYQKGKRCYLIKNGIIRTIDINDINKI